MQDYVYNKNIHELGQRSAKQYTYSRFWLNI
jgi:hypothetical protein